MALTMGVTAASISPTGYAFPAANAHRRSLIAGRVKQNYPIASPQKTGIKTPYETITRAK